MTPRPYFRGGRHVFARPTREGKAWAHYWQHANGAEGGQLWLDTRSREVIDFDGAPDLPAGVKRELRDHGYTIEWDQEDAA